MHSPHSQKPALLIPVRWEFPPSCPSPVGRGRQRHAKWAESGPCTISPQRSDPYIVRASWLFARRSRSVVWFCRSCNGSIRNFPRQCGLSLGSDRCLPRPFQWCLLFRDFCDFNHSDFFISMMLFESRRRQHSPCHCTVVASGDCPFSELDEKTSDRLANVRSAASCGAKHCSQSATRRCGLTSPSRGRMMKIFGHTWMRASTNIDCSDADKVWQMIPTEGCTDFASLVRHQFSAHPLR